MDTSEPQQASAAAQKTGYPIEIFHPNIRKRHNVRCSRDGCRNILKEPFQAECGHRFCKACVDIIRAKPENEIRCHGCAWDSFFEDAVVDSSVEVAPGHFISAEEFGRMPDEPPSYWKPDYSNPRRFRLNLTKLKLDKAAAREVANLPCHCPFKCPTPDWNKYNMRVKNLDEHILNCPFKPEPCKLCGFDVSRKDMPKHMEKECSKRLVKCDFPDCGKMVPFCDYYTHRAACELRPTTCQFCLEPLVPGQEEEHLQRKCFAHCPLGCPDDTKYLISDHFQDRDLFGRHMDGLLALIAKQQGRVSRQATDVASSSNKQTMKRTLDRLLELENKTDQVLKRFKGHIKDVFESKDKDGNTIMSDEMNLDGEKRKLSSLFDFAAEFKDHTMKLEGLDDMVKALAKDVNLLSSYETVFQDIKKKTSDYRNQVEQKIGEIETNLHLKDALIQEQKHRLDEFAASSYDGHLIWRIPNASEERLLAADGKKHSIYSPPFYTSVYGYKMCARIYFNGDGSGKGKFISLFFVVMQGNYDALLPWPFQQKVTMRLLDQSQARQHIQERFKPDPNSSSFRRPTGVMNIASGCPKFAPVEKVFNPNNGYVVDNTLFIHIQIDTEGIHPKHLQEASYSTMQQNSSAHDLAPSNYDYSSNQMEM